MIGERFGLFPIERGAQRQQTHPELRGRGEWREGERSEAESSTRQGVVGRGV